MKQIKPFFDLDTENPVHFCFQEAVLSAVIITLYIMFTDLINQYVVDQHSITKWKKYVLILIIMFVASFISIILILLIFGYKCGDDKKEKILRNK